MPHLLIKFKRALLFKNPTSDAYYWNLRCLLPAQSHDVILDPRISSLFTHTKSWYDTENKDLTTFLHKIQTST